MTAAIVAVVYGIVLPVTLDRLAQKDVRAAGGAMDLSGWSFAERGIVRLDGEWEFYPNRLLVSGDFAASPELAREKETIRVPGSWETRMPAYGIATYRLRVYVPEPDGFFGLKTLSVQMASRICVNGEEAPPAAIRPATRRTRPGTSRLPSIFRCATAGTRSSSMPPTSIFRPRAASTIRSISGPRRRSANSSPGRWRTTGFPSCPSASSGCFMSAFLRCAGKIRSCSRSARCASASRYAMTRGERIIYDLFDEVPIWLFLRIQMASTVCAGMAMAVYLRQAFQPYSSALVCRAMTIAEGVFLAAIVGLLDLVYHPLFLAAHTLYVSVPFLYVTYVFLYAAQHRLDGSVLLSLSALALNWQIFVQNINVYFAVPVFTFPPLEAFFFPLFLSLLMSLHFSDAFRQIERLSEQLLGADRLKDEFLSKTAHEFKAPLHGILHMAKAVADDPDGSLTREQGERLGLIMKTAHRLNQLVYDIMDLSRIKQGEMKIRPVPVDVGASVDAFLDIYAAMAEGKDIRLENRVPAGFPPVLADENRFAQMIGNLLDNAVKYTVRGEIAVTAAVRDGMGEISVTDTGIGIDERDLDVIFEPYRSMQANLHHSFGLGMPIVKQLVDLHGGYIRVESRVGEGSRFTIGLPLAERENDREAVRIPDGPQPDPIAPETGRARWAPEYSFPTPYVSEGRGDFTVLVVDDQHSSLKMTIDMLETLEYGVIGVKNGEEALEQLAAVSGIDLVILDLLMPGMSGLELCRKIRQDFSPLELPVLMVTASIHPGDKLAAFRAGANDFLTKPVDAAELRARAVSLLTMKELAGNAVDLEVAFLQSQMNPHFLFNALNNIMALSYTNPEKSRELTANLADYLRGSLAFENTEKDVLLSRELALIRSYAEIEKARYKDRVSVKYEIDEAALSVPVPPLLVQPLAENAIRHGIASRLEGGTVTIRIRLADGRLWIEVEDDGIGMSESRLSEVLGARPSPGGKSGMGEKPAEGGAAGPVALEHAAVRQHLGEFAADLGPKQRFRFLRPHRRAAGGDEFRDPGGVSGQGMVSFRKRRRVVPVFAGQDPPDAGQLFLQPARQHGEAHHFDQADVFLLDVVQMAARMENALRMRLVGAVVAEHEVELQFARGIVPRDRRDGVVGPDASRGIGRFAKGQHPDGRIAVGPPQRQHMIRQRQELLPALGRA